MATPGSIVSHAATTLDRRGVRPGAARDALAGHWEFHRQEPE